MLLCGKGFRMANAKEILGERESYIPPVLEGWDDCIITSDWELPDTAAYYFDMLLALGKKYNIRRLLHAGDVQANDQVGLSTHPEVMANATANYKTVLKQTSDIFGLLETQFSDGMYVITGNHDARPGKATEGQITTAMLYELLGIQASEYAYVWMKTKRGWIYVAHPGRYATSSLTLARKYYNTRMSPEKTKFHVVIGHTHNAESGLAQDGSGFNMIGLGAARDPNLTKYQSISAEPFPVWSRSVLMIRDGFLHHLVVNQTDFEFYLGESCPVELIG